MKWYWILIPTRWRTSKLWIRWFSSLRWKIWLLWKDFTAVTEITASSWGLGLLKWRETGLAASVWISMRSSRKHVDKTGMKLTENFHENLSFRSRRQFLYLSTTLLASRFPSLSVYTGQYGGLCAKVVEPLLCVHEMLGSNIGHDVWFTNTIFSEIYGDHHLSNIVPWINIRKSIL